MSPPNIEKHYSGKATKSTTLTKLSKSNVLFHVIIVIVIVTVTVAVPKLNSRYNQAAILTVTKQVKQDLRIIKDKEAKGQKLK